MKRVWLRTGGLFILVLLASCRTHPDYMIDFRFPIKQGDIEQGKQVTSIINPSHVVSEDYRDQLPANSRGRMSSPMPFHGEMTVTQLVDVVTFLNASYRLLPGYTEEFYY